MRLCVRGLVSTCVSLAVAHLAAGSLRPRFEVKRLIFEEGVQWRLEGVRFDIAGGGL